jgi:4-carboxymuconolactone decarboxylase
VNPTAGDAETPDPYETGERIRREVLGDQYVDRAASRADDFSKSLNDFLTEHCWGNVWAREGLDRRTRSAVTLSVLAALGRSQEIQTHVRGALRNGFSPAELSELFLHVGTYAGVPAAVDAFRSARPVIDAAADEGDV